ncbi:hypothetical protein [Microlunatus sp. GCM10028923]|uniref:hypothetical protein n=1 Tax=Microlunatus sp. GCM10028923 TaxID=3273400 RepID=UPI00361F1E34
MITHQAKGVSRRSLLGVAGTAALGMGLAGCGQTGSGSPGDGNSGPAVALPVWKEPQGLPTPDFPGIPGRLSAGYLSYPKNPPSMAESGPASGGTISAAYPISGGTPPPVERNVYWQAINKALNTDFRATLIPAGDYTAKFSVLVAGDDLPDLIAAPSTYPRLPQLLNAKFTDLTEYVSGSAIEEYPNLAYVATDAWRGATFENRIFAIPQSKEPMPSVMFARKDLLAAAGASADCASFQEFRELAVALSRPAENRWALGSVPGVVQFILSMLGRPNAWIEEGGKFTAQLETPEYRQAVSETASMWADGLFHPDAMASDTVGQKHWLVAQSIALHWDAIGAWTDDVFKQAKLAENLTCIVPPGFTGGPGTSAISKPWFRLLLMPKAEPDRVRELLRVLDYLYAPFGSKEYLLKTFGVEGVDFTFDGSEPIPTEQGIAETALMMRYVGTPPVVTYQPGQPEVTKARYDYGKSVQDLIIDDPTVGLLSETEQNKSQELTSLVTDAVNAIVAGKKPLDTFDETVQTWRRTGGDEIRREFEESLQGSDR